MTNPLLSLSQVIGRGFKETEVEFILCSCEAYGRFALHNEAHNQNDGDLGFNRQTKTLLDWTTEKVIPALLGAQSGETELLDLDLSRISNVSDSLIMPGSPSPLSPPKQKANLGRTPDRPSAFDMDQTLSHDPAVFLVTSVARSLLQSSCVVFAELLAVGSSCGDDIESSAVGWCSIFDGDEEMEEDENGEKQHIRAELLPSFIRLAIQLCKSSNNNCALLRALFVKCNLGRGMEQERNLMKKAVSALLSTRSNGAMLTEKLVETFFNAASELNDDVNMDSSMVSLDEDTSSVDMVLSHSKGCLATVLEALASNSNARRSLARKLVSRLQGETNITKANFDARCLLWLVENHNNAALTSIVSELEAERFEEGGEMRGVVHRLLESA